ncbi:MAG: hypothetical protein LBT44_03255 [Clostridiales bacterium]|nr:hypothetical protein [Clostridiales bacterium]
MDKTPQNDVQGWDAADDDIYWHAGFFEALQLEFWEYENYLEFKDEYQLSKEPLKIDALIIEKQKGIQIKKKIGAIFKEHNLIEYKSESDYISIESYYKVVGYGCLYKAFNQKVEADQITLTFIEYKQPRKLLNYLRQKRSLTVSQPFKGVYYIQGDLFPVQIIVNGKGGKDFPEDENIFLRSLRRCLTRVDMLKILAALYKTGRLKRRSMYLELILRANRELVREVYGMMKLDPDNSLFYQTVSAALKDLYEERGWIPEYMKSQIEALEARAEAEAKARARAEAEAKARMEGQAIEQAKSMLNDGFTIDTVVKYSILPREKIESLLGGGVT